MPAVFSGYSKKYKNILILKIIEQIVNGKYLIIHSPQGFSEIIYNTCWGTLPDCLGAVYK